MPPVRAGPSGREQCVEAGSQSLHDGETGDRRRHVGETCRGEVLGAEVSDGDDGRERQRVLGELGEEDGDGAADEEGELDAERAAPVADLVAARVGGEIEVGGLECGGRIVGERLACPASAGEVEVGAGGGARGCLLILLKLVQRAECDMGRDGAAVGTASPSTN